MSFVCVKWARFSHSSLPRPIFAKKNTELEQFDALQIYQTTSSLPELARFGCQLLLQCGGRLTTFVLIFLVALSAESADFVALTSSSYSSNLSKPPEARRT